MTTRNNNTLHIVKKSDGRITQFSAIKFYANTLSGRVRFYWLYPVITFFAKIMTWRIPALLIANMISDIQMGLEVDYQKTVLIAAGLALGGEMLVRFAWYMLDFASARSLFSISAWAHEIILKKSLEFHNSRFAGSSARKISKLAMNADRVQVALVDEVIDFISTFAFAVYVLGVDGLGALGMIIGFFLLYIVVMTPAFKKKALINRARTRSDSEVTGALIDSISNVQTVKSYAQETHEEGHFQTYVETNRKNHLRSWHYTNLKIFFPTSVFYVVLAFGPLIFVLSREDSFDVGRVFIIFYALDMLASRIWNVARIWRQTEELLNEAVEGLELLDHPVDVDDVKNAKDLSVSNAAIDIKGAHFKYDKSESVYSDLSLDIKSGEKIGLVGPSGGGKTTLVKLLMRFMDLDSGSISIDDQNIATVTQDSLRSNISYIPQEPLLFHRSIGENILYGNPSASREEVIAAAKKAHAHEFIVGLQNGYDTLVGERGVKLSGGQRQRVAIARAFLKDAPILILDEATSALDSESEKYIQQSLVKLMKGRTVISIAHRLSTLQIMDKLIVIEKGKITESGNHKELVKHKGTYSKLWKHQSGDYL